MAPKIEFNKKEKILSIRFSKKKSVDSDIQGNVVIDYDKAGNVVNMEVMDINLDDFVKTADLKKLQVRQAA